MIKNNALIFILTIILMVACGNPGMPKPFGFYRVDLPVNEYQLADTTLPFRFEISTLAELHLNPEGKFWMDIIYPSLNATIHCSYKRIENNLYSLSEDAHRLVYKHIVRADDISERFFSNPDNRVYGIFYNLLGNSASNAQFVLTDSVNHFIWGAVYFNHVPNKDSIAPMADFIRRDVVRLMESFEWK